MNDFGNTWVEIDLGQLKRNLEAIREKAQPSKICCVIKANAYGHGAVPVARALEERTDYFAVANFHEVKELRQAGILKPILCLGYLDRDQYGEVPKYDAEVTVYNRRQAEILSEAMVEAKAEAKIHIKVDTGMHRLGFQPSEEAVADVKAIADLPGLRIAGIYTHFACADIDDMRFTDQQYEAFRSFADRLQAEGVDVGLRHVSNSAGILDGSYREDMVRAGIILYGIDPNGEDKIALPAETAMRFCAKVASIRTLQAGDGVSYGQTWHAEKTSKIATVTAGYADGYFRSFSGKGSVVIRGIEAPIVGRVCMDQLMVDITNRDDVRVGDSVVLMDKAYPAINFYRAADLVGTIPYELFCAVSRRVTRVYVEGDEVKEVVDYLKR